MSEWVFALLVRLYPAAFRRKYQQEALQLYRDRIRDERGLFRKLRLSGDILTDAVVGIPRAWQNCYAEMSASGNPLDVSGLPSFHLLDREPLGKGPIVTGCVFSVTALVAFGLVMRLPAPHHLSNGGRALSPVETVLERLNSVVAAPASDGSLVDTAAPDGRSAQANTPANPHANTTSEKPLTPQQRDQVVQAVAENLTAHYFDRQKAQLAADKIQALQSQRAYEGLIEGPPLAARLTADIRNATGDPHLSVVYSRNAIPGVAPAQPTAAQMEQYRAMLIQQNCSIEKVEILPGNIGYFKLNAFPDVEICSASLRRALMQMNGANVVVFDLRDNTGGYPETVAAVAAPLFDRTVAWYNPRAAQSATKLTPAAGSKLADKPVYILTSSRTLSGAEQFTYNLKMLKRATVVGQTTGGGAHVGAFHRINDHYGIGIPETKITNPFGKTDWDVVGVEPDVKVKDADALNAAEKLALARLRK